MLELYQTEWCPASRHVRQRLTELGLDYVVHQVAVERAERRELVEATGSETIPVLVLEDGSPIVGEEPILACLADRYDETTEAEAHRAKAEKVRRRYLEEECKCSPRVTRSARRRTRRSRTRSGVCAKS